MAYNGSHHGHNSPGRRLAASSSSSRSRSRGSTCSSSSNYLLLLCWCCCFLLVSRLPTSHARKKSHCFGDWDPACFGYGQEGKCINNTCTNGYHYGGCLSHSRDVPNSSRKGIPRVCGSEDPPEALEQGHCRKSPFGDYYTEVRILVLGWESSYIQAWILQIILSEVLHVPVSIETGFSDRSADFYGIDIPLDLSKFDSNFVELNVSSEVLDCRTINNNPSYPDEYTSCAHVVPEVWDPFRFNLNKKAKGTGPFRELGMLASRRWYIPKFTALRNPSLTSVYGLGGDDNRQKLAETFKRPTMWKVYCEEVSNDGCATDDGIASRPPIDDPEEEESTMMFKDGNYTGHFRYTDANNCTGFSNNETCTGHFADYPCEYSSLAPQQIYYNDIALESNGYTLSQLKGIWKAANATKSDVMMMWSTPEMMYEEFFHTDAEFIAVTLPPSSRECNENRDPFGSLCDPAFSEARNTGAFDGSLGLGACDTPLTQTIKKFISNGLVQATFDPDIPEAFRSPAYAMIDNFRISSEDLRDIFNDWRTGGKDRKDYEDYYFEARYATCKWVKANLGNITAFFPEGHPRVYVEVDPVKLPAFVAAQAIACIAVVLVTLAFISVAMKRKTKAMFYAQVDSFILILTGLLLLSFGALLLVVPHTDTTCIVVGWLINLGYAVHLAPLTTKIFEINGQQASSGKQMERIRLGKLQLYRGVTILTTLVVAFMTVWTMKDPPAKVFQYDVTGEDFIYNKNEFNMTKNTLTACYSCRSESNIWQALSLAWQGILLLPTAVVAFVSCKVIEDMNDTKTLSTVVYFHSFFLIFRATFFLIDGDSDPSILMAYRSLLISADIIISVVIQVFSKLLETEKVDEEILPDLFLNSSIFVADVMGFAAWSSAREPHQVFKLLETLYETFDNIAAKHKVFKVETVRDCYVAATGIPDPESKHAEIIAKFAIDVLKKMDYVSKKLELMFGPDTSDLTIRVGIHSGPVTGGFLKGKGARFQLFGDTMTTACLIQKTGISNRIHLSQVTAKLLIDSGNKRWITKRDGRILTEEKGELETYWLTRGVKELGCFDELNATSSIAYSDLNSGGFDDDDDLLEDSQTRWVEWNVEVLSNVLRQILAQRVNRNVMDNLVDDTVKTVTRRTSVRAVNCTSVRDVRCPSSSGMPLDEVAEIIELPAFDKKAAKRQRANYNRVLLDSVVKSELKDYVTIVANMYINNPFHNFAHASYVVMAVSKYMNRIVSASEVDLGNDGNRERSSTHETLHDHTYGIVSDPLTRFACVFSALIHDIDHPGVPNNQLIQENFGLALVYKKRSVAEQNSFDMAWDLLGEDKFARLRSAICQNAVEFRRFRQIVVNSVMATDLGDKESKALRNGRWSKAFAGEDLVQDENLTISTNRKATIVIEHLIQAADIAHTCQHWGLYRKWNERLFQECYKAFRDGRAEQNPADGWYGGEIGFYEFYIIPLAKKLRDCGVFGPTSDENLNYAKSNKAQWEKEGHSIVAKMLAKAEDEYNATLMDLSCNTNNMLPNSELEISALPDEKILIVFEDYDEDGCKNKLVLPENEAFDSKEVDDEHVMVRFKN